MSEPSETFDAAAELHYLRELPAVELLANHFFVLAQWAAVHLALTPPDLAGSQLVIDTMSAIITSGDERLGPNAPLYRSALAEIQQAFVRATSAAAAESPSEPA
jgi:hypothetical protein